MNSNDNCTCPSGDGSLRHPCPAHPPKEELKVGDVVSTNEQDNTDIGWVCHKIHDQDELNHFIHVAAANCVWQRGIHPSLIPDGFKLLSDHQISQLDKSKLINQLSETIVSQVTELDAARKEIATLTNEGTKSTREGWQIVPIEPNIKMSIAFNKAKKEMIDRFLLSGALHPIDEGFGDGYKAMLKAAPKPEDC